MYEKSDPYFLPGPGGVLNLKAAHLKRSMTAKCTSAVLSMKNAVCPETGRCATGGLPLSDLAGTRDPIMIAGIDKIIDEVKPAFRVTCRSTMTAYASISTVRQKRGDGRP